jgi:hypothetical protein
MQNPVPESLQSDLKLYKEPILEVSSEIVEKGISKFPVFVAHQHEVSLGEPILNKDELNTNWTINATVAEELIEKKVIMAEKADYFKKVFKDPKQFICLFVIKPPDGASFIFVPVDSLKGDEKEE